MKKKLSATKLVLLLLSTMFVLLVATVLTSLFWPSPPIVVSKETTYITEPLDEYGNVDYVAALEQKYGGDLPPEKNAAYYYLQAMDPDEEVAIAAMYEKLGLDSLQREDAYLECLEDYAARNLNLVLETLRAQEIASEIVDHGDGHWTIVNGDPAGQFMPDSDDITNHWREETLAMPWTRAEYPLHAAWIDEQQGPLNHLRAGAQHTRCYFPIVFFDDDETGRIMYFALMTNISSMRQGCRRLIASSMLNAGEGKLDAALRDLEVVFQMGVHSAEQPTLVSNLVGIAIQTRAIVALSTIVHECELSPEALTRLAHMIEEWPLLEPMTEEFRAGERYAGLDLIIAFSQGKDVEHWESSVPSLPGVDWNITLQRTNHVYDQIAQIAETPPGAERDAQLEQLHVELNQHIADAKNKWRWGGSVLSRRMRSELTANIHLSELMPATAAIISADDRLRTRRDLLRVSIALARYRAEHGSYPDELKQLVPNFLAELPVDRFSDGPFRYRKTDEGFKLYSIGPNGQDNGGLDATADNTGELDYDLHDDCSLHQPQPIPRAPWLSAENGGLEQEFVPEADLEEDRLPDSSTVEGEPAESFSED